MATKPKKPAAKAKATRPAAKRRQAEKHHDRAKLVPAICKRLATGEPLAVICRDLSLPIRTVHEWRETDAAIKAQFDEARDLGYDAIARECLQIADTPVEGEEAKYDESGALVERKVGDMLGHRKLQIETRLKLLAKWDPRRYGDKVQLADSNGDNLPAPQFIIQPVRPKGADE